MRRPALLVRAIVGLATWAFACSLVLPLPAPAAGQSPTPVSGPGLSLTAEPMLGGIFRPGSWAAFRVAVQNHGPTVNAELRLSSSAGSTFGRVVQLAPDARQEHVLYGQMGPFAGRFTVTLVSGADTLAEVDVAVEASKANAAGVYILAEQPQALVGPVAEAIDAVGPTPKILTITPEQLPPRAEAWSSADLLVWQDVDSNRLDADRLNALRTWLATGGHLVIAAGSSGAARLGAFPADLLPYQPTTTVDVPITDLEAILGVPPAGATSVPALTGALERGTEMMRSGDSVVAARAPHGQGSVALLGIDPQTTWLTDRLAAMSLWSRVLPSKLAPAQSSTGGDAYIVNALNNLPAVQLPSITQLALLILAYILAIGPINYIILRRRDRREWAWVTMPATIVVFAVGAYVFGSLLRGASVVVNELAIVNGSTGADRGLAQMYVGVYSPGRSTFDVRVGGDALVSAPATTSRDDPAARPVDVLLGDPATLRGYDVGFGALRGFRAEAMVATPLVNADLRLVDNRLLGSVTNSSDVALEHVAVVYGSSFQLVGELAVAQSHEVSLATRGSGGLDRGASLADRLFPYAGPDNADTARNLAARRAIVRHLSGGWDEFSGEFVPGELIESGPVILAWRSGATLEIDVGTTADHVGERLYVLHAPAAIIGPVSFGGDSLQHTTLESDGLEAFEQGGFYSLLRGTITAEYRAVAFEGAFQATSLMIEVDDSSASAGTTGEVLAPLPAEEQPESSQPLAADPRPDALDAVPRIQLFDQVAGTWVEFEPVVFSRTYEIADASKYVDGSGAFRVRFVVRSQFQLANFTFSARLSGTVQ